MVNFKYTSLCICTLLTMGACSSEGGSGTDPLQPSPTTKEKLPISINTSLRLAQRTKLLRLVIK